MKIAANRERIIRLAVDGRAANTPKPLGAAVYCRELLRELVQLDVPLHLCVYLDAPPNEAFPLHPDQADIRVLPATRFWSQRRLGKALRKDPPDALLCPVSQFPLRAPCPVLVTHHGLVYEERDGKRTIEPASCLPWRQRMRRALLLKAQLCFADHFLMVSEDSKQMLLDYTGISSERASVTYHGCSDQFVPCLDDNRIASVRERYALPEHFFLYTGRLGPRKNVRRILLAYEKFILENPDLPHKLVLAGGEDWRAAPILKALQQSPCAEKIHHIGHVGRADMPVLMSLSDALVLVSLCESFGIPVVEAMACGTPVITANNTAMPEIVGDAALLASPYAVDEIAAAFSKIATDPALCAELVQKGYMRAQQFTWENTAIQTWNAIEKVLQRTSGIC